MLAQLMSTEKMESKLLIMYRNIVLLRDFFRKAMRYFVFVAKFKVRKLGFGYILLCEWVFRRIIFTGLKLVGLPKDLRNL